MILFHIPEQFCLDPETFLKLKTQIKLWQSYSLIAILDSVSIPDLEGIHPDIQFIRVQNRSFSEQWNQALSFVKTSSFLYMDNRQSFVQLKDSAVDIFSLTKLRHPESGMIYSDYEIIEGENRQEIHLLSHHPGRLRDNQDYGSVFFFDTEKVKQLGGLDEKLNSNHFYDLRLKLSESSRLTRISNKYDGSVYSVFSSKTESNVFDYLLSEKSQQLEAETILSHHLERIHAKLSSDQVFLPAPKGNTDLIASVIIPVNQRPEFIGTAIESVQQQNRTDVEIIVVVNGGKDDPTIPVVNQFLPGGKFYDQDKPNVQLLITDINNIGFCINLGVKQAKGVYYVQLDSDDRLKPNAVESIVKTFDSDPTIGMVIGSYEVWEKLPSGDLTRMEAIPVVTHDEWTDDNGRNNLLRINGAGAPRSIPIQLIKDIGWFEMNDGFYALNYGEDYDMVLRVSEHYKIGRIYDPIYEVIRHEGGTDHSISQSVINRNDEAKDRMRFNAILRRQNLNKQHA